MANGSVMCDLVGYWQDVGRKKKGKSETENDLNYPTETECKSKRAMTSPSPFSISILHACNYYLQPPSCSNLSEESSKHFLISILAIG